MPKTFINEPRRVPLAEAAAYGPVKTRTLRDWIAKGLLPGYRIGPRLILVDLNDLDRLMRRIPTVSNRREAS
jgi:excisionase family DNA binding protein